MPNDLNAILADCDAAELALTLQRFDLAIRMHVPEAILLTTDGELNLRNKYGAILMHCRQLSSILHNFQEVTK